MRKKNLSKKLEEETIKYKVRCKCGHTVIMPKSSKITKTICVCCGYYIYKNDLERFKDLLKQKKRKIDNA